MATIKIWSSFYNQEQEKEDGINLQIDLFSLSLGAILGVIICIFIFN